jgi:hypothetical protein
MKLSEPDACERILCESRRLFAVYRIIAQNIQLFFDKTNKKTLCVCKCTKNKHGFLEKMQKKH